MGFAASGIGDVDYAYQSDRFLSVTTNENNLFFPTNYTTHEYQYQSNSRHVQTIHSKEWIGGANTGGQHWSRRHTDLQNRLTGIRTETLGPANTGNPQLITSVGYQFDWVGRRTRLTREDATYWQYNYNDKGELTGASRHLNSGGHLAGQNFAYDYDGIGNRKTAAFGGDSSGSNMRTINYTPDNKNQYTSIAHPRYYNILAKNGASASVTVEVNSSGTPQNLTNQGNWFRAEVSRPTNTSWEKVENEVADGTSPSVLGELWVPPTSRSPLYDDDGNLTSDGRWTYTWDARNQLVQMKSIIPPAVSGAPALANDGHQQIDFAYDWLGRRISKKVQTTAITGTPGNYVATTLTDHWTFLYDGWNMIGEFEVASGSINLIRSYTWALDLSGSLQGAGGVGGLLRVKNHGTSDTLTYPAYDGNGNVIAWSDLTTGSPAGPEEVQKIDYDPFGNVIGRENDLPGGKQRFGFSTKYEDAETGLLYYGYRYYDPVTGRWPSRDPIGEEGGMNLYGMMGNNAVGFVDYLGLIELAARTTDAAIGNCGGLGWKIQWGVLGDSDSKNGGQILQKVKITKKVWGCDQEESDVKEEVIEFFEIWRVLPGSTTVDGISHIRKEGQKDPGDTDHFGFESQGCSQGWIKIEGSARYYPNQRTPEWKAGSELGLPSHMLLSSKADPKWDKNGSSNEVTHLIEGKWNCCPTEADIRPTEILKVMIDDKDDKANFDLKWKIRQLANEDFRNEINKKR